MNWTDDKKLHYKIGFYAGRYGTIIGFILIAVVFSPLKELCDWIVNKIGGFLLKITSWIPSEKLKNYLNKKHQVEWYDYVAGVIGAYDGMVFNKYRFPEEKN